MGSGFWLDLGVLGIIYGLYRGYIWIMEKKRKLLFKVYGFRVSILGNIGIIEKKIKTAKMVLFWV